MRYSNYSNADIELLQTELLRVTGQVGVYNTFRLESGATIQGATETEVISHLTGRDHVKGRQTRFPGLSHGGHFAAALHDAGFKSIRARNYRGQLCNVITL